MKSTKTFRISLLISLLMLCIILTACAPAGGGSEGADNTVTTTENSNDHTSLTPPSTETTTQKQDDGQDSPPENNTGWEIGKTCPAADVAVMGEDTTAYADTYNINDNRGKITVINFWYTQCVPCIGEMPHFDQIAAEYADELTVLAIHADNGVGISWIIDSLDFIDQHYFDSKIRFGFDHQNSYYQSLGGTGSYPRTLIIDADGTVSALFEESISYDTLKGAVDALLSK